MAYRLGPDTLVVGVGESLFDRFPDGVKLGGAPVNFAVHAYQLVAPHGGQGVVVSRVGTDSLGDQLIGQLASRHLVTKYIQRDSSLPTGVVEVCMDDPHHPTYTIVENVAWDHLAWEPELEQLARACSGVCFGTLAQRSVSSKETIHRFLAAAANAVRLYDVNLRQHYYNAEVIAESLRAATALKLNSDELRTVGALLGLELSSSPDDTAHSLCDGYDLDLVALTRGAAGTVIYSGGRRIEGEPVQLEPQPSADSVGAGDACCAGVLYGLLAGWPPERIVALANRLGAYVASQPGATPKLPEALIP